MLSFFTSGSANAGAQVDDALRRQFLDRLADVQVACWAAEEDAPDADTRSGARDQRVKHRIDGHADPILSATPESVLIGFATQLNDLDGGTTHPATGIPALSDDHFETWDKLDKNRELLTKAKTLTAESQIRARRTIVSAGLVGCGVVASITVIGWLGWSTLEGKASTDRTSLTPDRVGVGAGSLLASTARASPVKLASANAARPEVFHAGVSPAAPDASVLAGRFSRPMAGSETGGYQAARPYLSQVTSIEVTEQGEAPLRVKVHASQQELLGAYAVLSNLPSGVFPTVGGAHDEGRWKIDLTQLTDLGLVLGAAAPNSFDLRLAVHTAAGSVLSELGMTVVLKYRPSQPAAAAGAQVVSPSDPVVTRSPATVPAVRKPAVPKPVAKKIVGSEDEAPRPKAPMRPKPRDLQVMDTSQQMGVGVTAARSRPKPADEPAAKPVAGGSWWNKPQPEWARGIGGNSP